VRVRKRKRVFVCVCVCARACLCMCVCVKDRHIPLWLYKFFVTRSLRISNLLLKTKPENTEVNFIIKPMYLFFYGLSVLKNEDKTLPRHVGLRLSIQAASRPDERTSPVHRRKS